MPSHSNDSPVNPLPPVVWALTLLIVGIELVFQIGDRGMGGPASIGWRAEAINRYAFSPQLLDRMIETGTFDANGLIRFVSYAFVHIGFGHMLFVVVFLLALGKMVGELFSAWAVVVIFLGSAVVGSLAYGLIVDRGALLGGYPAVYGLIGAYTFILWVGFGRVGENRARAFTLIGFLLGIQLLFGALFGGAPDWIADLGGFAAGFVLSFVVSPGGWNRVMAKLRNR